MLRIVSLLPSATEIVAALGFQAQLVGRSHECDFPPGVEALPVLTRPAFPVTGNSREIDLEVKALLERGLSLYQVDAEALRALRPDVIVTQSQCEVCAVSEAELEKSLAGWLDSECRIVSLRPNRLEDVWADLQAVAAALGAPERGRDLVKALRERLQGLEAALPPELPSVVCLEWFDPLMAGGNWLPELVTLAGGRPLLAQAGAHSPWLEWPALRAADPDALILSPCGFSLRRCREELPALTGHPRWRELRAVRKGRVTLTDGNQYFNRPGPRLVESAEILAEILHPKKFHFGHRDKGWESL